MATTLHYDIPGEQVLEPDARERLATAALRAALLLGVAGDLLLRGGGLGLNALLFALMVAATAWTLDRQRGDGATRARLVLLVPVVGAGVTLAWRGTEFLSLTAVLWCVLALALHAASLRAGPSWSPWRLDVTTPVRAVLRLAGDGLTQGAVLLARDVPARAVPAAGRWRALGGAWRGLLAAVPLAIALNALLMSADPIWERQVARVVDVDLTALLGHFVLAAVLAWLAAGWLRGALLASTPASASDAPVTPTRQVSAMDVLVPLGVVNVLFGAFVLLQLRTLAGGAAYVQAAAGLTFAEYARRGFFELVAVAAITLPALLVADALTPLDHRARRGVGRAMTLTLVLLGGILASAAARMALYLDAYGLTEDRFYASVAMAWLAVVLGWFAATVLRGRRERFIGGALASAWLTWAALVVASPDALIVRANVARLAEGRSFDASYVAGLGPDAAPALVAALPRMTPASACVVRQALSADAHDRARQVAAGDRDWRAWSVAAWRAERAWRRGGIEATPREARAPCPPSGGSVR